MQLAGHDTELARGCDCQAVQLSLRACLHVGKLSTLMTEQGYCEGGHEQGM